MIVGMEVDCYVCAERLTKWLQEHKEEINKVLATDLKERAIPEEHEITKIGTVTTTVELEKST